MAGREFPVFAPLEYVDKIRRGDVHDPLLRQVLPLAEESEDDPQFVADPVGDANASLQPGLLHKYHGRVLLVATGACAIHCRYCFRREFPYHTAPTGLPQWEGALEQIRGDASIDEVLLSGGDPLTLVDHQLRAMAARLAEIPHVRRLRIHTRLPIVIPQRVTGELLDWLCGSRLTPVVVVHANHPRELDETVVAALGRLVDAGVPVLNQAVLLRGVNDSLDVLEELCRVLVNHRVTPYYLHQLDRVRGARHFETPVADGLRLIEGLRERLPGYAVPRYVQEVPGEASKRVLA